MSYLVGKVSWNQQKQEQKQQDNPKKRKKKEEEKKKEIQCDVYFNGKPYHHEEEKHTNLDFKV